MILGISGLIGGSLTRSFSRDSKMTVIIIVIGLTFFSETIGYLVKIAVLRAQFEGLSFLKIVSIEMLYNAMLVIIIYPIFRRSGQLLADAFADKNILTRYF